MTANNIITDKKGNYQILDVELNGHKITLTNVNAPSGGQYEIQKDRKSLWTTLPYQTYLKTDQHRTAYTYSLATST